eukprot:CAMPEP_0197664052 /NCGR_PEP_ID=MMETSP1338-20131121/58402_1 /TAXON_ID=43686 ORGANISM="Pelagodinium beii, Strain RCC1491" /NCGR_SAMPLE_ID=MMETSP1338 /ASSEMBLY_ACC=CAM_ASM_000754 /LENGTH=231 /DNA_ID=CAMNT_0043242613 /DNA_START=88 /DNA_END=783 /DNA_ORIENTATION=+
MFANLPPMNLNELALPSGTSTLIFGTSYANQLADNILLADDGFLDTVKTMPSSSSHGQTSVLSNGVKVKKHSKIKGAKISQLSNGAKLIVVANAARLQQNHSCIPTLRKFLKAVGPIHHAFFMRPHPECFFKYQAKKAKGEKAIPCVDLATLRWKPAEIALHKEFWKVLVEWVPRLASMRSSPGATCREGLILQTCETSFLRLPLWCHVPQISMPKAMATIQMAKIVILLG